MSRAETQTTMSDVRLERYRLGELPADELEAIAATLADDPALRQRLLALERSDREISAACPSAQMAAAIRRRSGESATAWPPPTATRPRGWLVPVGVLATSVCVAAVSAILVLRQPVGDETTIKGSGDASLVLHRKATEGSEELSGGAVARPGDQIRIGYRASGRSYGAILSIDGRGTLTQHLPSTGDRSAALQPAGTVFLDFAYELDDAPRWEAFYFVTADGPFDLEPARRAVREATAGRTGRPAALRLPGGLIAVQFLLNKDPR